MLETLQTLDQELLIFLNSFHSPYWDNFMWIFTGKWVWIPLYASILYVICKNFSAKTALWVTLAVVLTFAFTDAFCASVIRPIFERWRPSNPNSPISDLLHYVNDYRGGRYGFPSCHSSNTFGLAFILMFIFKNRVLTISMLLWAAMTCYTRIYLGVHYPGDILAGMVVGFVGAFAMNYLLNIVIARLPIANKNMTEADQEKWTERNQIMGTTIIVLTAVMITICIALYSFI